MADSVIFQKYFDRLMGYEGGYINDHNDPGGETKWGISKRSYPNLIIKALTREDAFNIYKRDFWDNIKADNLPDNVSFQLFDFAVNSGIDTAIRCFQRALGVANDGHFGPVSQAAAAKMTEPQMNNRINADKIDFMN